jgi:RHS repeat-associated protein
LTQGFLYLGQFRIVAELDSNNNVVSRFVYGTRSHVPDYLVKNGITYRLITDHLGSVRFVVDANTGSVAQQLNYDEFGVVLMDTNPGFQPFGFAGGLYDVHTKLVRFGARDYDAETGRWTAKDPTLFSSSAGNLYEHVGNDPINYLDISGFKGGGGGSSPSLGGVGSSKGGLAPDVLRALKRLNEIDPNRAGRLAQELKSLLTRVKNDAKRKAADEKRLKDLEKKLKDILNSGACPAPSLQEEINNLRREIRNLDQDIFDAKVEYGKVVAQIDLPALLDPLADFISDVQDNIDPATWLTKGIQSLSGTK